MKDNNINDAIEMDSNTKSALISKGRTLPEK
jgi:hypothetical protein